MSAIMATLPETFRFSIFLLIPPVIILYAAITKKPTIPGMLVSSVAALILAVIFQGVAVRDGVDAMVHGFTSNTGIRLRGHPPHQGRDAEHDGRDPHRPVRLRLRRDHPEGRECWTSCFST
jgi:hypothetical protein